VINVKCDINKKFVNVEWNEKITNNMPHNACAWRAYAQRRLNTHDQLAAVVNDVLDFIMVEVLLFEFINTHMLLRCVILFLEKAFKIKDIGL